MSFKHRIESGERLAIVTATGPVNLAQSKQAMLDLGADSEFDSSYNVLVDMREMIYSPSSSDVQVIATNLANLKSTFQGRVGIVVSGDLLYGMARMTCIFAELSGFSMSAFRDYAEAREWIKNGIEFDYDQQNKITCR